MFKQMRTKKSGGAKFSWKQFLSRFRIRKKTNASLKKAPMGESSCIANLPSRSQALPNGESVIEAVDIHEVDKDRIRTICKEALQNPPQFPSREEVKGKIEDAHKYYGVKCVYINSDDPNNKTQLQPSWYYILERPLVEQYVLMNNYIRKLSVMASLKSEQSCVEEEIAIEEEVSTISSLSDYEDFAPDSIVAAKLKELKKRGAKESLPSQMGAARMEQELCTLKRSSKVEERTVKTNDYTIIIRESTNLEEESNEELVPSSSAIEYGEIREQHEDTKWSSGDHLPDMKDFDLSYNLVDGPLARNPGLPLYHWQGNSTPTKTALLNMDCQPPVRLRAPGTARDFLSFRNLSLSSEFVDSCRGVTLADECQSPHLKELTGPGESDDDLDDCISLASQTVQRKDEISLTKEDSTDSFERNPIETAVLVDCRQECEDQTAGIDSMDSPDNPCQSANVLTTSESLTRYNADVTESVSSVTTQILATSTNPTEQPK